MRKNIQKKEEDSKKESFYFGKAHFKLMFIGLVLVIMGFILMLGYGANTRPDGTFDPNYWNEDIFSVLRIRIAPLLVIVGFVVQVFAILKRNK